MRFVIFDTETTSNEGPYRMLSIGWIVMDDALRILGRGHRFPYNPHIGISPGAEEIHGLSQEFMQMHGENPEYVMDDIYPIFQRGNLVGHNVKFDVQALVREMQKSRYAINLNNQFCTMRAMTNVCKLPRKGGGYKFPKLSEMAEHFGINEQLATMHYNRIFGDLDIPVAPGFHSAAYDVTITYLCLMMGGWACVRKYYELS